MNVFRLYSDAAGESHFEQVDLKLTLREFAPPAAPLRVSDPQPAQNCHPRGGRSMGRGSTASVTSPNDGVQFIRLHSRDGKFG